MLLPMLGDCADHGKCEITHFSSQLCLPDPQNVTRGFNDMFLYGGGDDTTATFCVDVYTYRFTGVETTHSSGPLASEGMETRQRERCTNVPAVSPTPNGTHVRCWRPVDASRAGYLSTLYACGNPACVKLFDPDAEHAELHVTSSVKE